MSTITSLDFSVRSSWDGSGIRQARTDLAKLKEDLDKIGAVRATAKVAVDVDDSGLSELRASLREVGGMHVTAHASVDVDDSELRATIIKLDEFGAKNVTAHAKVDVDAAEFDSLRVQLEAFGGMQETAHANVDTDAGSLEALRAELEMFGGMHETATANVDADSGGLDALRTSLSEFGAMRETATASVNADDGGLSALEARLSAFGGRTYTAHVDVDTNSATSNLHGLTGASREASSGLQDLGGSSGGAGSSLDSMAGNAASAGRGLSTLQAAGTALIYVIAALVVALLAMAPAVGGLVAILGGLGMAFGVVALALAPVIQAIQAHTSVMKQAGQGAQQNASRQVAAAQAIRNAQRGVTQAQQQAAHQAQQSAYQEVTAAEQVKNAQRSLGDAVRAAARQRIESAQRIAQAERSLQSAEMSERMAQQNLTQARRDAKIAMDDLKNSVADSALSLRAANLQVQQAAQSLKAVMADAKSTDLMRAQAKLAYDQAKQAVIDQTTRLGQLTAQQKISSAAGVEGSKQVVAAKSQESQASAQVSNAERALTAARTTAANDSVRSSEAISKAQQGVADAQRNVAKVQADSAYQNQQANARIRQAEQQLADMRARQAAQFQSEQKSNSNALNRFGNDMARLSAPGKALVNMLIGLGSKLSMIAQNAFLPGFNKFVKDALTLMPQFTGALRTFGELAGGFFAKLGTYISSPLFKGQFASILKQMAQAFGMISGALLKFLPPFFDFLKKSGPATRAVAGAFAKIVGTGLPAFFKSMEPAIKASAGIWDGLGKIFAQVLPLVGKIASVIALLLQPAIQILYPIMLKLFNLWADQLVKAAIQLNPLLMKLAKAIVPIYTALIPLIPAFAQISLALLKLAISVLTPLIPVIVLFAKMVAAIAPILALVAIGLAKFIGYLTNFKAMAHGLKVAWDATWNGMKVAAEAVWNALKIAWDALVKAFVIVWNASIAGLKIAWNAIWNGLKTAAEAIWNALKVAWQAFINAMKLVWDTVSQALKSAWNTFWNAIKSAAEAIWNAMKAAWQAFLNAMRSIWNTVSSALKSAWNSFWNAMKSAASAVWNAMKSAWQAFLNGIRSICNAFTSAFKSAWNGFWGAIKSGATKVWNDLQGAWKQTTGALKKTAQAIGSWFIHDFWNPLHNFFVKTIPDAFKKSVSLVKSAWKLIKKAVGEPIYIVVHTLYTNGIKKLWDNVAGIFGGPKMPSAPNIPHYATGGAVNGPGTGTSDSIVARLSAGEHVITAAEVRGAGGHAAVAAQRSAWGSKSGQTTTRVMDDGSGHFALGGGWNPISTIKHAAEDVGHAAASAFHAVTGFGSDVLDKLKHLVLGGVAKVVNPLIQAAANSTKTLVKKAIPGSPPLEGLIAGGNRPVQRASGPTPGQVDVSKQGALGGPKGIIQSIADRIKDWITQHDISPTAGGDTAAAQKWADKQVGKPYSLGSFGNAFDCSSFMSGIASIILGKKPAPMFTTFAFTGAAKGPATFEKNLKAPFMVGVENRGIGHMAGTLNGKNYEATPPKVRSGPGARGAHDPMFDMVYGMKASASGGTVPTGDRKRIIDAALKAAGVPPPGTKDEWERGLNTLITRESNWNAGAINKTDSNARAGNPSQGLAQVVPSTFAAYHVPGTPLNIKDPVANVAAAIAYIVARYGNITKVQQANANLPPHGYAAGTKNASPGAHLVGENGPEMVMFNGGEKVLTASQTQNIAKNFVSSGTDITNEWRKDWTTNHAVLKKNLDEIQRESDKFNAVLKKTFTDNGKDLGTKWKASWDAAKKDATDDFNGMTAASKKMWVDQKAAFTDGSNYLTTTFFPPVNDLMVNKLPGSFTTSVANIGKGWLGLEKTTHDPVAAVVDVVYNKGIVAVWNQIAKAFGAPNLATFTMPGFAVGGAVNGPGTGTSDSITARLSAGEHVWTAAEVSAAGGHAAVARMRSSVLGAPVNTVGQGGRFATGGAVVTSGEGGNPKTPTTAGGDAPTSGSLSNAVLGSIHQIANPLIDAAVAAGKVAVDAVSLAGSGIRTVGETMGKNMGDLAKKYITQNDVLPTVGGGNDVSAQAWADSQVGKPYVLGGDFVTGIDCSEYQSGIARAILGQTPAPWFTTFAFNGATAPEGFEENLTAPYMVGVTNEGVGHMSGTLNGKNYEATPPAVRSGPSARGWDDPLFPMHYGFRPSIQTAGSLPSNASHLQIIDAAMAAAGVPPPDSKAAWESGLNIIITNESAWDPNAINNYDINAQNGVPSQGLAQVIPPTFSAYHVAGTSTNILDPLANVAAAIAYIVAVYGSINNVPGVASVNSGGAYLPYRHGTSNASRGWHMVGEDGPEMVWTSGGESVWDSAKTKRWMHGQGSVTVNEQHASGESVCVEVHNHWHGNPSQQAVQEATGPMVKKLTQACKTGMGGRSH